MVYTEVEQIGRSENVTKGKSCSFLNSLRSFRFWPLLIMPRDEVDERLSWPSKFYPSTATLKGRSNPSPSDYVHQASS
jgi:hypothetical protein